MSRLEDFDNAFWDEPDVEELSANATLLYIWSWTNRRCGMAGIYKVSLRAMADSKVPAEQIPAALDELAAADFAYYEDGVLWVRSRVKRLRTKGMKMALSIVKDLNRLPVDHPLRGRFIGYYGDESWLRDHLPDTPLSGTHRGPIESPSESSVSEPISDSPYGTHRWVPRLRAQGSGPGHTDQQPGPVAPAREAGGVDQDQPPDTLPEELQDRIAPVLAVLARVHAERGGNEPTVRGVGLALAAFPNRDHHAVVGELEHWSTAGNGARRPQKDWVRLYRTFLERSPAGSPPTTPSGGDAPRRSFANAGDLSRFDEIDRRSAA